MKTTRALTVLSLALAIALPVAAQVKDHRQIKYPDLRPFTVPQPERVTLPNGMIIMMLEDHELPLIEVRARIRAGARMEPAAKVGLASIFGEVLRTGGTAGMTGDQIDDFLEARAAVIETFMGDDSAGATVSCLSQDFPQVLKVFAEILRQPVFADDKIAIAKNEENAAIARRNDNPMGIMNREFEKLVYGADSPYARSTEYATIAAVTREDLLAFHKTYVHPNRIILGLTGDFNTKEMAGRLKTAFGDWRKGPEPKDPAAGWQTAAKPGIHYVQKEDMTQSDIIMGHLGIRKDDPDFFAVEVLNEAFGGSFAARLFSNIRSRKGLAYSVRGTVGSNYDYPGLFNAWMTTKTETTAAGIDALLEEIDAIVKTPPTEAEVTRAKESILSSFIFNFDSKAKILNQQITYAYFGYPDDFLARYRENIEKVTPADVARVAKKHIRREQMPILVVGPSKGLDRPLESFGKVAKLDITIPEPKTASAAAPASAESVARGRTVLAKVVEGLGGSAAVDGVKAVHTVVNAVQKTPMGEMSTKITTTLVLPDRVRQEIATPMGQMVLLLIGDEGYMQSPRGTQALEDSRRMDFRRQIQRQPVILAQHRDDPDLKVQHAGTEAIGPIQADKLVIGLAGDEIQAWVDQATGRIIQQAYRGRGPSGPGDIVATFSDFRQVEGLTVPFKIETTLNGEKQGSTTVEEYHVNPTIDAALFTRPEVAPPVAQDGKL